MKTKEELIKHYSQFGLNIIDNRTNDNFGSYGKIINCIGFCGVDNQLQTDFGYINFEDCTPILKHPSSLSESDWVMISDKCRGLGKFYKLFDTYVVFNSSSKHQRHLIFRSIHKDLMYNEGIELCNMGVDIFGAIEAGLTIDEREVKG